MLRAFLVPLTVLASISFAACTTHQDQVPGLAGPSGFAVSIDVTATPDHVRQDGQSQSAVTVTARDSNGQPIAALALRLDMMVGGTIQDFGTLSSQNAVTGKDGRATVVYTAPASVAGAGGPGATIDIVATSVGSNGQASQSQSVSINLVPPGVILPPAGTPTAAFAVSPIPVAVGVAAQFDASSSRPGTGASQISSYNWAFGDGATASGALVNHTFATAGSFNVTLTVTNDRGFSATTSQTVVVGATALPTAAFVFSPATPVVGQVVSFNAATSAPAPGRTLRTYEWNFGDGTVKTGLTTTHDFVSAGVFAVSLTVTDDLGQRKTATEAVTVTAVPTAPPSAAPTADFVFSPAKPSAPLPGVPTVVQFNAQPSKAATGRTIVSYQWNWGDGKPEGTGVTTSHPYDTSGTFTVVLTVTDDQGQTGTAKQSVPVGLP